MSSERTARIEANPEGGRDFVVGDVHGEFPTLEALLELLSPDRFIPIAEQPAPIAIPDTARRAVVGVPCQLPAGVHVLRNSILLRSSG